MITEKATAFAGLPVAEWNPELGLGENPAAFAWRVEANYNRRTRKETLWTEEFAQLLEDPHASEVTALIIGRWEMPMEGGSGPVMEALAAARDRLANLTALFAGDVVYQDGEIFWLQEKDVSWVQQSDVSPLFYAYPRLTEFVVRGGTDLRFGQIIHGALQRLTVETGNLSRFTTQEILVAELPALEHLEIWFGSEEYGADTEITDLAPLFSEEAPRRWPKLRSLGLRNVVFSDAIARHLAASPLLAQLEALDLSLGGFGDEGAIALLKALATHHLLRLDIHHHFVTPPVLAQLMALGLPEFNAEEKQTEGRSFAVGRHGAEEVKHRFVAMAEELLQLRFENIGE